MKCDICRETIWYDHRSVEIEGVDLLTACESCLRDHSGECEEVIVSYLHADSRGIDRPAIQAAIFKLYDEIKTDGSRRWS